MWQSVPLTVDPQHTAPIVLWEGGANVEDLPRPAVRVVFFRNGRVMAMSEIPRGRSVKFLVHGRKGRLVADLRDLVQSGGFGVQGGVQVVVF